MNRIAFSRAPLRLGLAGGGSDLEPFCSEYGGRVLNATISKHVFAQVSEGLVAPTFRSLDQKLEDTYPANEPSTTLLPLHQNTFEYFSREFLSGQKPNLLLQTYTDAPVGSGLGTSSTLVVSLVAALAEYYHITLSKYEIAQSAQIIEREMCGFAGGRQDGFSATFGGFNYMEFGAATNVVNSLKIPRQSLLTLEANLLLFHMGTSRLSSKIIEDQAETIRHKSEPSWEAMMRIRNEAKVMKNNLLFGDMKGVVNSLRDGWVNKKATSSAVTNQYIDEIYDAAIQAGASAGKVSGAGGGGFMLFFVEVSQRPNLLKALASFGGFAENVSFTDQGVESWTQVLNSSTDN